MLKRMRNLALVCVSIASACADEASEAPDVDALASSAFGFQRIEPCPTVSSYVPRAVVRFEHDASLYSPPCVRLASGGTVVFRGRFAEHPLEPRTFGITPTPIVATSDGGSVEFEFPDPGFYPYGCAAHPEEIGVIWASAGF